MQCRRCHHTNEAHRSSAASSSLFGLGPCGIPECTCPEYQDAIKKIDEDLL